MLSTDASRIRIGLDLDPTQASWSEMASVVRMADGLGYDSLWTWDHLYGTDDPRQRIFEGWTTIAAWGAMTTTPTVGLLVLANTFRNPGLVAKSAVTVDHISGGRCILGLGAGWRPLEHHAHGIEFGSGFDERLDWLEESVTAVTALLRGEAVTTAPGGHYNFAQLRHAPLPWNGPGRLPILIGGGGERRTIPIAARFADIWHHRGSVDHLARKVDILVAACAAVGRDPATIQLAFDPHVVIRNDPKAALGAHERSLAVHYQTLGAPPDPTEHWFGPPDAIVERWRPYLALGFRHLIVDLASPYDQETIARMPEVRDLAASA
jgi:alkanesulfonate monooxygenase SsuD/methylene tetrahydromethanopterin reductase-like flavin-dependent oxidoreductase (luciferase family)